MIHTGDCVEVMASMDEASVDAICTDPPYGLEFMGKEWDRLWQPQGKAWGWNNHGELKAPAYKAGPTAQQWHQQWATAALRVAKPGAYLLAFGGTRTVHRLTVALEDAGWIIRDVLCWVYASGFPKSRASLKPAWEPIVLARKPGPLRELGIDAARIGFAGDDDGRWGNGTRPGGFGDVGAERGASEPNGHRHEAGRWPANVVLTAPAFDGGWDGVVGGGESNPEKYVRTRHNNIGAGAHGIYGEHDAVESVGYGDTGTYSRFFQLPGGDSCDWCGAPIAPLSFSRSSNGASAPDDVPTMPDGMQASTPEAMDSRNTSATAQPFWNDDEGTTQPTPRSRQRATSPANGHQSFPAKSRDAASLETGTTTTTADPSMCDTCAEAITSNGTSGSPERPDAPRWLIVPKASRSDREPLLPGELEERHGRDVKQYSDKLSDPRMDRPQSHFPRRNTHPTVKPVELMRHLVRLVTPPGGTVLDPFAGSGSTLLAAEQEGFPWVGIEREPEYVRIAEQRLVACQRGLGLAV